MALWNPNDLAHQEYFLETFKAKIHERDAEFYADEYRRTADPWNAVNASGHYRKCKQADKAHVHV